MSVLPTVTLLDVDDADFAWMLGDVSATRAGRSLPEGGIDAAPVLAVVRRIARSLSDAGVRGAWAIVHGDEVVGICSYLRPPADGEAEIGYGIAASRRNRGLATAAVAAVVERARADGITSLTAETAIGNQASAIVLERNGFVAAGERIDRDDGPVRVWVRLLGP